MEKELYPLDTINDIIGGTKTSGDTSTTIRIEDAGTETAKVLVPQYGSDKDWLEKGKIDWRRFGHIDTVDPYWMAYFLLLPKYQGGVYASDFVEQFANLSYGVDGRHKKLTIDMQKAVSGRLDSDKKPKKKRSTLDRILGRNKEEDE